MAEGQVAEHEQSPPRPRRGPRRRWAAALALGALAVVALIVLVRPVRVGVQALLLLPGIFPGSPLDPLSLVAPRPVRTEHAYTYSIGTVDADMYHPGYGGRHAGVVLMLGAVPVPKRDPLVVQFAQALARSGIVVLVPESSNLLVGRVRPEEKEALARSFELLVSQPDVDPERAGFIAFSVGGGLSVAASASRDDLRERVRFVNVLGGYFDVERVLLDAASRSIVVEGKTRPWEPDPRTIQVLATALVETLPNEQDRTLLWRAFVAFEPVADAEWAALSLRGQQVRTLLTGTSRDEAARLIATLPAHEREVFAAISPSTYVADLRTRLYLMHDTADSLIPFTETRHLAASAPAPSVQRFTEFSIFGHVVPDRPAPLVTFVPELWTLYWHVHAVLLELL